MPNPKGATSPIRLQTGANGAVTTGMDAPKVTREQIATLLATPTAAALLDLATGTVTVDPHPADSVWDDPTRLVLLTHADVTAAAAEAAGHADFLGRLTRIVALDLAALARAGEIPTAAQVAAVMAEIAQYDTELAEVIDLNARRTA